MERWFVTTKKADFNQIAAEFGISPVLARLIRNRDIVEKEEIRSYLYGKLEDMHDPASMKDLKKASDLLLEAVESQKKIRIIGDYDIDGVNATHILLTGLERLGAVVDTAIPDRIADGYGINQNLIMAANEAGVELIITCDNGIAAIEEIAYAKQLGMTVIVTDHHDIPYVEEEGEKRILESEADAIVNPKQEDCRYPFKGLCGAAVAYKLIEYLYQIKDIPKEEVHALLEFAAIATVGDVMDLLGENRIIVKEGLARLRSTKNPGLAALMQLTGVDPDKLSAYHIGFVIGPCINASGRLDSAARALELLQAQEKETAEKIAGDLKALNDSRKAMTLEGTERAYEQIRTTDLKEDNVLVVYLEDCHESLAGIIAGRVREAFHKPAFVLTDSEQGVKGSGRSIEAYHMFEELVKCRDIFTKFGGHPMAAGLSLPEENVELMRRKLNENAQLTEEDLTEKVSIDIPMPISYVTEELIQELELLEPFGKANPKPVFAQKGLSVRQARVLGKNKNVLKMLLADEKGYSIDALYFGDIDKIKTYMMETFGEAEVENLFRVGSQVIKMAFTYYPSVNEYNGRRTLQIIVQSFR